MGRMPRMRRLHTLHGHSAEMTLLCVALLVPGNSAARAEPALEAAPKALEPGDSELAWTRARVASAGVYRCARGGRDVEACLKDEGPTLVSDYRIAFMASRNTNLDALRSCHELAVFVTERASAVDGKPVCQARVASLEGICSARYETCALPHIPDSTPQSWPWWPHLKLGALLARQSSFLEAKKQFMLAYEAYQNSTHVSGRFIEAWYILREIERVVIASCRGTCRSGDPGFGELMRVFEGLFERFRQVCHRYSPEEVRAACEERNRMRVEWSAAYARVYQDYQTASDLLASAYDQCVDMSVDPPGQTAGVLRCWMRFGRRSLWLRVRGEQQSRFDARQVESARLLVDRFVSAHMHRNCGERSLPPMLHRACSFLADISRERSSPEPAHDSLRAMIFAHFPVPQRLDIARHARPSEVVEDPSLLLDSPLWDYLLAGTLPDPASAVEAHGEIARVRAELERFAEGAGFSCPYAHSDASWSVCSAIRMLELGATRISVRKTPPAPLDPPKTVPPRRRRPLRAAGLSILAGLGAGGLLTATFGGVAGELAQQTFEDHRESNLDQSASQLRESPDFTRGEAMNRAMVAGFALTGVGVVVGTTLLLVDARVGRAGRRADVGLGKLSIRF